MNSNQQNNYKSSRQYPSTNNGNYYKAPDTRRQKYYESQYDEEMEPQ